MNARAADPARRASTRRPTSSPPRRCTASAGTGGSADGGATDGCTPTNGGAEVCDGLDNNCNGAVDDGNPGDWVLIHVGFAMSRIDEAEAAATLRVLNELGEVQQELTAMAGTA